MGRKGSWISAVKKKTRKSKGWFWKRNRKRLDSIHEGIDHAHPSPVREMRLSEAEGKQMKYVDSVMEADNDSVSHPYSLMNTEIVQENHANLAMDSETEQERHDHSVARATASAAEAAVAAAQAAAEVARLTASVLSPAKSKEEIAAIMIQSVFRGNMARSLWSIKGLGRLKKLVRGQSVKRQAITTLRYMWTMSRVQAEVRARRIRMLEENCAFQIQLQQNQRQYQRKDLEKSRASVGEDWNDNAQSKEHFEAMHQRKTEAAIKRERASAYAYSHQQTWRNSSKPTYTFMDSDNAQWGFYWLERWVDVRPWENRAIEKEQINDTIHAKNVTTHSQAGRDLDLMKKPTPQIVAKKQTQVNCRPSVSTPRTKRNNAAPGSRRRSVSSVDGDARSAKSVKSDRCRRHSVTQSSARYDESVASSSALHRYMVPTESAKAKSRLSFDTTVLAANDSVGTTKKRLSFSTSPPAPRRHSVLN